MFYFSALTGDMSSRRVQPEVQTKSLKFSPAGKDTIISIRLYIMFNNVPTQLSVIIPNVKILLLWQSKIF